MINNYRPVSNLPFIAKIIEKVVFKELSDFLNSSCNFDKFQSGLWPQSHSTEIGLIKVLNDIWLNTVSGKISVLVLLDLSAAFDTADHGIWLDMLEKLGRTFTEHSFWFRSYLEVWSYFITISCSESNRVVMTCGIPQGSVLGPPLFNLYMLPLGQIVQNNHTDWKWISDISGSLNRWLQPNRFTMPMFTANKELNEIKSSSISKDL